MPKRKTFHPVPRAGWQLLEWCNAVGFGRAKYYALPDELKPKTVKIGWQRLVIESPAAYLERMRALEAA